METRPEQERIEARLKAAAPELPETLRRRVMQRCLDEHWRKPAKAGIWQWRLAGVMLAMMLLCGGATNWLDAQNRAINEGRGSQKPSIALVADFGVLSPLKARSKSFADALGWRIRQLAQLLDERSHS
ncbi:MAG TPA: hypothetical protein VKU00_30705 [Chthonomonadaceae bacterium]|nr:hypothetical protein [Chthonomonadaceae bacterium]